MWGYDNVFLCLLVHSWCFKFIHTCDSSPIVKIIYRLPKSAQKIITYYSITIHITLSLIVPSLISNVSCNTFAQCMLLCCTIWIIITLIITSCILMWCIVVNRWPLLWILDCLTYYVPWSYAIYNSYITVYATHCNIF